MGTVMMVWVCSLPLKAFDLAWLMLRKFYKACFSCCTNQAIAGSPQVSVDYMTLSAPPGSGTPASDRRDPGGAIALQRRRGQQMDVADRQPTEALQRLLALKFRQIHLQPADLNLDRHLPRRSPV